MVSKTTQHKLKKQYKKILKRFHEVTKEPESFLSAQPEKAVEIKTILKDLYGISVQQNETVKDPNILPQLVVDGMDEEQIWQQLELHNNAVLPQFLEETSKALAIKDDNFLLTIDDGTEEQSEDENEKEQLQDEDEDMANSDEEEIEKNYTDGSDKEEFIKEKKKKPKRKSVVDDKFFKLSEMEEFLNAEDQKEKLKEKGLPQDSENEIDYFNDVFSDNEDEEDLKYKDFFDPIDEDGEDEKDVTYKDFFAPIEEDGGDKEEGEGGDEQEEQDPHLSEEENPSRNPFKSSTSKKRKNSDSSYYSEDVEKENPSRNPFKSSHLRKRKHSDNSNHSEEIENDPEYDEEIEEMGEAGMDFGEEQELEHDEDINFENDNESFEEEEEEGLSDGEGNLDADERGPKSSFEVRQEHLKKRIEQLEEKALSDKPWQLKGEITATSRPQNSLLEEVLQFDANTQPAPIITEKTTMRLEDVIKQRISNKAWDDPVRTVRPIQTPQEFRKKLVLDQEKSKESLTQIYEKEYRKELEKLDPNHESQVEEPKEHKEIKEMMRSLFIKLDALSNFHYTPKPVAPEPKIITNTPAVNMEEVAPVAFSNAKLLAPEEVRARPKGDVLGKSERSRTDKNRERRKKKLRQKAVYKAREERDLEKQKLGIKLTNKEEKDRMMRKVIKDRNVKKMKTSTDKGSIKSSKAFFNQLQDTTTSKMSKFKKNSDRDPSKLSAKKLKL